MGFWRKRLGFGRLLVCPAIFLPVIGFELRELVVYWFFFGSLTGFKDDFRNIFVAIFVLTLLSLELLLARVVSCWGENIQVYSIKNLFSECREFGVGGSDFLFLIEKEWVPACEFIPEGTHVFVEMVTEVIHGYFGDLGDGGELFLRVEVAENLTHIFGFDAKRDRSGMLLARL